MDSVEVRKRSPRQRLRQFLLNVHLYGGLLVSPYLIIFGLSSLNFNHHFVDNTEVVASTTKRPVSFHIDTVPSGTDAEIRAKLEARANSLRDSLRLRGWTLPWETRLDDKSGVFETEVVRPGRKYLISVDRDGLATVEERHLGTWKVAMALHGFQGFPGSTFAATWSYYTEFTTWFVLLLGASGIYLWSFRRSDRRAGLWTLAGAAAAVMSWFVFIVVRG
jgi:hypothetical protein